MKIIYLIRHGTTQGMEQGIVHGSSDSPLSEKGLREAEATGRALLKAGIQHVYTSPLGRALQTAQIIAKILLSKPILVDGLREMGFGQYEGTKRKNLQVEFRPIPFYLLQFFKFINSRKYGENMRDFRRRVLGGFNEILAERLVTTAVVVAHTGTIWLLLAYLARENRLAFNKKIMLAPCGISKVSFAKNGKAHFDYLNDINHLQSAQ